MMDWLNACAWLLLRTHETACFLEVCAALTLGVYALGCVVWSLV